MATCTKLGLYVSSDVFGESTYLNSLYKELVVENMNNVNKISKSMCSGCSCCSNICPVSAITMKANNEGFLMPTVDENECINCGLCFNACPINSPYKYKKEFEEKYYAFYADEETRNNSSSGGLFHTIAIKILNEGGAVCGCRYSDDFRTAYHTIITDVNDLKPLQKSKYFQSEIRNVYREIKQLLNSGRKVLFSGTPCQVDGLNHYLKGKTENLLTIDIVCHGVPSPKAHQKFLDDHSGNKIIKNVDYRSKKMVPWGTIEYIEYDDGSFYYSDIYNGAFCKAFLEGLSTRESCATCKYSQANRIGDITIGDFWGITELDASFEGVNGVNLVSVNSEKGNKYINPVLETGVFKEFNKDEVINLAKRRNGQFLYPRPMHYAHKRFFEYIEKGSLENAYNVATKALYDIGIVGWWYNLNYGGTLTYYALNETLKKMGYSVLMINRKSNNPNYKPDYNSIPYRFAQKEYWISRVHTSKSIYKLNDNCKVFISGSDQLFSPSLWEYSGPEYYLDFVNEKNKIISYASSFGQKFVDRPELTPKMKYWLKRFDAISVREDYGVDILKDNFGLEGKHVLDPVFLCGIDSYDRLAARAKISEVTNFFVAFTLDPSEKKRQCIQYLEQKLNLKNINLINADHIEQNSKALNLPNTMADADIEDWVYYYKNAEFILTDSFHGTCFAIIFHKPFVSIANKQRGDNRFRSLLKTFDLESRLVEEPSIDMIERSMSTEIDWNHVDEIMASKREDSLSWLRSAIEDYKPRLDEFDLIEHKIFELESRIRKLEI